MSTEPHRPPILAPAFAGVALLLATLGSPREASGLCFASEGLRIRVLPSSGALPANGRIVVAFYQSFTEHALREMLAPRLESAHGTTMLEIVRIEHGFERTFVTLASTLPLEVDVSYVLILSPAGAKSSLIRESPTAPIATFRGIEEDTTPPKWTSSPKVADRESIAWGCGPSSWIWVDTAIDDASDVRVRVDLEPLGEGRSVLRDYLEPSSWGLLSIGHGMCGGLFEEIDGLPFRIRLTAEDAAGLSAEAPEVLEVVAPAPQPTTPALLEGLLMRAQRFARRVLPSCPRGTIEGVVRGPAGEPLADVEVSMWLRSDDGFRSERTRTDATGAFRLAEAQCGEWSVSIDPAGPLKPANAKALIDRLRHRALVTLALEVGESIAGKLTDPDGPVGGREVFLTRARDGSDIFINRRAARTAADGSFRFEGLPGGRYEVEATRPQWGEGIVELWPSEPFKHSVQVAAGERAAVLRLPAVTTIRGKLRVETGLIPETLTISLTNWGGASVPVRSGTFELKLRGGGDFEGEVKARGFRTTRVAGAGEPGQTKEIEITLKRSGGLAGRVVDETTKLPIGGASVEIGKSRERSATRPDGSFFLENAGNGPTTLTVAARGYATSVIEAKDDRTLEVSLARGLSVAGRVRLNGEPLIEAQVEISPAEKPRAPDVRAATETDRLGRYEIEGVSPGRYVVAVQPSFFRANYDYTNGVSRSYKYVAELDVDGGTRTADLDLHDGNGKIIVGKHPNQKERGYLRLLFGRVEPTVSAKLQWLRIMRTGHLEWEGPIIFEDLPAGEYTLVEDGNPSSFRHVTLTDRGKAEVDLP
ncbi:MAG: carboxypeptidase regulatory-like domain-containing protein [Deltaproteobacteria bacterium]|nr:carboxypeptidase regulatory-like domain-containing protein [Deltaproteobacteria bacterium]